MWSWVTFQLCLIFMASYLFWASLSSSVEDIVIAYFPANLLGFLSKRTMTFIMMHCKWRHLKIRALYKCVIKCKFNDIISVLALEGQHLKSSKSTQMIVKLKFSQVEAPLGWISMPQAQSSLYIITGLFLAFFFHCLTSIIFVLYFQPLEIMGKLENFTNNEKISCKISGKRKEIL